MASPYLRDKSWMYPVASRRLEPVFMDGVRFFTQFAYSSLGVAVNHEIYCPCRNCVNSILRKKNEVEVHILRYGFVEGYTTWSTHGEKLVEMETESPMAEPENEFIATEFNEVQGLVGEGGDEDCHQSEEVEEQQEEEEEEEEEEDDIGDAPIDFAPIDDMDSLISASGHPDDVESIGPLVLDKYKDDAKIPLYPHCKKFSKLSFFVRLFQIKCKNRWSNQSFTDLLALLKEAFPDGNEIASSWYESQKMITNIGLKCVKIHACQNDCILYRKEYTALRKCPKCNAERYKPKKDEQSIDVPVKLLRHFPIIPRLRRLYMCEETAEEMKWHHVAPREERKMSHPRDSMSWSVLNEKHPSFNTDPRNVRLGLASDGFSPFAMGRGGRPHSTWPVLITVYNLPPWKAMSQPYIIMSLLIDGPSSPGKNIDVYLQPLIDELMTLWTGVKTYDAHAKQFFQMRAALMWTINDFPAYGMLSGWITQGKLACPCCHIETSSVRLKYSSKESFMGHRRFLGIHHRYRKMAIDFNGKKEKDKAPSPLSGEDVLNQWRGYLNITFGKTQPATKCPSGWRKLSCFFSLPYWVDLPLRHNLDVMHIEKGVSEHILNLLLCKDGKTKDNLNARCDLADVDGFSIREELQPQPIRDKHGCYEIPPAIYNLNKAEKQRFLQVLKELKVPDGFSANIAKQVQIESGKIVGLKSHDYHILMQHLLPLCLRASVRPEVGLVLNDLCSYFRLLCSKNIAVGEVEKLEKDIPVILSTLEMIFPPSFFDIIVHLCVHLATEVKMGGPVHYRWMYPIERYLFTLKNYIRNKHRPEGSIAEGYLLEEVTSFCARFLDDDVRTKVKKISCVPDGPIGGGKMKNVSYDILACLDAYVLLNNEHFASYAE